MYLERKTGDFHRYPDKKSNIFYACIGILSVSVLAISTCIDLSVSHILGLVRLVKLADHKL